MARALQCAGIVQIVDKLEREAAEAFARMNRLASDEEQQLEHRRELDAMEKEVDLAVADGVIDESERSRLTALFASNGLDPRAIDRALSSSDPRQELHTEIDEARARSETNSDDRAFQLGVLADAYASRLKAASEISNAEHRTYMTIIGNLKA